MHSNLDNSQLLDSLKTTSPILRLNLHGDYLVLASRDCHVTIVKLKLEMLPSKGGWGIVGTRGGSTHNSKASTWFKVIA